MSPLQITEAPRMVADQIPGYDFGSPNVATSPIDERELEQLKQSSGFTPEDEHWLHVAGEVLADHTRELVEKWRAVISSCPHLASYSLSPDGQKIPHYSEQSGLRFQQWILDTCFRPYNQDWLNYQQEIALRHTSLKKNKTDHVESAPAIRLRDLVAFTAVINDPETLKPLLAAKKHSAAEIDKMYQAWCKSVLLQVALWTEPYTDRSLAPDEW